MILNSFFDAKYFFINDKNIFFYFVKLVFIGLCYRLSLKVNKIKSFKSIYLQATYYT